MFLQHSMLTVSFQCCLVFQKLMRKGDNTTGYFQGKRASQLLQNPEPIKRFGENNYYSLKLLRDEKNMAKVKVVQK